MYLFLRFSLRIFFFFHFHLSLALVFLNLLESLLLVPIKIHLRPFFFSQKKKVQVAQKRKTVSQKRKSFFW
jgi:hypothetical protein